MEEIIKKFQDESDKAQENLLLVESFANVVDYCIKRKDFEFADDIENGAVTIKLFTTSTFYVEGYIPFSEWLNNLSGYLNVYKYASSNNNPEVTELEKKHESFYSDIKKLEGSVRFLNSTYKNDSMRVWKIAELFDLFIVQNIKE